ncbi:MAG: RluA family pseudouridine synthase [Clostridium sp.]|nr:RluA family pseudouridine synthase [Prevotella sp.]MCM1428873.1 RluA family pseudouridine synthase [Clostridium sp.]
MNRHFKEDKITGWINSASESRPLMEFIREHLPQSNRTDIKAWLKHGHFRVAGVRTTQFDYSVAPGDTVEFNRTRPFTEFRHPRLDIVYEDDDIIVVNKGYGLLSVGTGSAKKEETAYDILKEYVKSQNPANKIFVVHRLDRATSGLMMFAKSMEAQTAMQHNWNNMVLDRRYVAVCEGIMRETNGIVRSNLSETSQFEVYSSPDPLRGKTATTRYFVLSRGSGYSLVEFELDTGRKNQIRVHAKDMGHPIVGDRKYGASASPIRRLALHARTLNFAHPITRRLMQFSLPVPSRFSCLLKSKSQNKSHKGLLSKNNKK